jgi:shikimate kinase
MMHFVGVLLLLTSSAHAFAPASKRAFVPSRLLAGGFEWEDPKEVMDQGVENPFKNPALMDGSADGMKVDPARLLGPRLSGSNLYFIGMMGSGKTAVGDVVARRKC